MPAADNDRIEHLKMIQTVITRMAQNSFLIKGWTVTLIAALFALAAADSNPAMVVIALVPVGGFWLLDAYFLRQERLFRGLYDTVRAGSGSTDFSMRTDAGTAKTGLSTVFFSVTLLVFYGLALITILIGFTAAIID